LTLNFVIFEKPGKGETAFDKWGIELGKSVLKVWIGQKDSKGNMRGEAVGYGRQIRQSLGHGLFFLLFWLLSLLEPQKATNNCPKHYRVRISRGNGSGQRNDLVAAIPIINRS